MPVTWLPGEGFFANSYLFGDILIDAGVYPMAVAPHTDRIRTIVITHTHYDHIAHLKEITAMTGAEVCVHALDVPGLTNDTPSLAPMFCEHPPMVIPDRVLADGERVGGLLVIHTPGHTPGGISLYSEEERALFCGDTVFTGGSFGRYDFPGGDGRALAASIERLCALDVEGLYPGHGEPVKSGGSRHVRAASLALKGTR
ncbi:MBL fold metallo-hydrolase [Methanofollis ethanolicus]|uniref:MBL fold metallo-hydrolase n=1 Tax=Methanofollis ethanolicus TaxID=488124 RepID=UPI00082F96F7|nr:MBL fold metallo-hydrolase [Methanofollis ethanolicus]